MTKSEENVIKLFKHSDFSLEKIPEGIKKSPDFLIKTENQDVFIEVKEITENQDEKELRIKFEHQGYSGVYLSPEIGKRFRTKISEANQQLKEACNNGEAGIVIIQDVRPFITMSLMPQEEVKLAMFGERQTWFSLETKKLTADLFTKNKTTAPERNTSISAVGLLIKNLETSKLTLHLYHNPHAKNKLRIKFSKVDCITEYTISDTINYHDFIQI